MSISIPDFWKLVIESQLLTAPQCQQLGAGFGKVKGAAGQATARTLAEWLVAEGALSRYQAAVLLAGRPGPFFYGEYRVTERLERGRWEGVFRAVHAPTGHPVSLHFLTGPAYQDTRTWSLLAAHIQARCAHPSPCLMRWFELVDTGAFKFLVAEDLAGETLEARLAAQGRLPPLEACAVARETALGLAHLHQLGALHGDLRPREVWLMEGGLAKLIHDPSKPVPPLVGASGESADELAARADYAAPELGQAGRPFDVATDVYALGCTLYQMLTGLPPFAGGSVADKLRRHATEPIQPLETWGVPSAVGQIVAYMMAKNVTLRFPHPQLVADQLAPFCDPARLYARPALDLPTLAAYETHLRRRLAGGGDPTRGSAAGAVPSAPAALPTGVAISSSGNSAAKPSESRANDPARVVPAGAKVAASLASLTPAAGSGGGKSPVAVQVGGSVSSTTERMKSLQTPNRRNLIIMGSALAVATVVVLVLAVMLSNWKDPKTTPEGDEIAAQNDASSTTGSGGTTSGERGSGASGKSSANPATPSPAGRSSDLPPRGKPVAKPAESNLADGANAPPEQPAETVVPDDGALLWASPTHGSPLELDLVPLDSHFVLSLKPADLLAQAEGARLLQACGPALQGLVEICERGTGFKLQEMERILWTLHDHGDDWPRSAVVVRLREPLPPEQLAMRWGGPPAMEVNGGQIYQGAGWAYYVPEKSEGVFLMATPEDVKVVAEQRGAPPPLRRELGILRRVTDQDRHLTVLATPNFLVTNLLRDGRKYYFGEAEKLRRPVDWFLRDEIQAVSFSLHLADDAYLELRMIGTQGKDRFTLAKEVRDRLQQVPEAMFEYIATLGSNPYWERVRLRFPAMINFLHSKSRIGADGETAAINCRLPLAAAHNLAFGAEMVLVSTPGAAAAVATTAGKPQNANMSIEDILFKHQTNISFEAQSLEFALQDIAKDVNESLKGLPFEFKIKIMGDHLQLDGITRNQTVRDFMQKNKTVGEVLTAMMMKANAPNVPDPTMPEQKLIWVIDKDPENPGKPAVLITTRQMADKNKYALPPPFKPKQ